MQKIISLFQRNYDGDRRVRDEVVPGAEWVIDGEGDATEKWDGTCCMVRDGVLYKRHDVKPGKQAPDGWEAAQAADPVTGHWPGWLPVGDGPEDQWHRQAWEDGPGSRRVNGTYELVGPKVQGNPYDMERHELWYHGASTLDAPRDFVGIREYLEEVPIEGIVWHHDDGRMVKIKARDFGIRWPR